MRIEVNLPLQSRLVRAFTPEALRQLAEAAPGTPVVVVGRPSEKVGVVVSARVEGESVRALLDVEMPPALRPLVRDDLYSFGINATAKQRLEDGERVVEEVSRLNAGSGFTGGRSRALVGPCERSGCEAVRPYRLLAGGGWIRYATKPPEGSQPPMGLPRRPPPDHLTSCPPECSPRRHRPPCRYA